VQLIGRNGKRGGPSGNILGDFRKKGPTLKFHRGENPPYKGVRTKSEETLQGELRKVMGGALFEGGRP